MAYKMNEVASAQLIIAKEIYLPHRTLGNVFSNSTNISNYSKALEQIGNALINSNKVITISISIIGWKSLK